LRKHLHPRLEKIVEGDVGGEFDPFVREAARALDRLLVEADGECHRVGHLAGG
jgi:hypothetical protein